MSFPRVISMKWKVKDIIQDFNIEFIVFDDNLYFTYASKERDNLAVENRY